MNDLYKAFMDGTLWDLIGKTYVDEKLLTVVTDEEGNEVNIIRQTSKKDGNIIDSCRIASYPDGTLYPGYASKIVSDAMRAVKG